MTFPMTLKSLVINIAHYCNSNATEVENYLKNHHDLVYSDTKISIDESRYFELKKEFKEFLEEIAEADWERSEDQRLEDEWEEREEKSNNSRYDNDDSYHDDAFGWDQSNKWNVD